MLTLVNLCSEKSVLNYAEISEKCGTSDVEPLILACCFDQLIECRIDQKSQIIHVKSISDTRDVSDEKVSQLIQNLKNWEKESLSYALKTFETKCEEMNSNVLTSHQQNLTTAAVLDQNMKNIAMLNDVKKQKH